MTIVAPPKHGPEHPDRLIDAECAVEPAFQLIIRAGIDAGWSENEMTTALLGLVEAQIEGMREDGETEVISAA